MFPGRSKKPWYCSPPYKPSYLQQNQHHNHITHLEFKCLNEEKVGLHAPQNQLNLEKEHLIWTIILSI